MSSLFYDIPNSHENFEDNTSYTVDNNEILDTPRTVVNLSIFNEKVGNKRRFDQFDSN